MERAEATPLVACLPPDDDELLPRNAFDLEPVPGPGPAIGGAGLLGDNPLAAFLANGLEQSLALGHNMIAVKYRRRHCLQQRGKPLLALEVRQFGDVLALIDE